MKRLIDKLLGREGLRKRNDYLIAANNRLGKQILELRRLLELPKRKKQAHEVEVLKTRKYLAHIEAQRQHYLVKALSKHMPQDVFLAECKKFNDMTDAQVEALK